MQLEIEALGGGGRGVAHAEGQAWFVAGALPGEVVEAVTECRRAGIVEARATSVLRASPWREAEPCPVAATCGGCDLAHVRSDASAEVLRAVAAGALRHAPSSLAAAVAGARVVVSPWRYRLRATLHWDPEAGRLGFFGAASHQVVDIAPCRVVSSLLLGALEALQRALGGAHLPAGELSWLEDIKGARAVAGWTGWGAPPRPAVKELVGFHPLDRGGRVRPGGWGEAANTIRIPFGGGDSCVALTVPVGAFFQGNRFLVPRLFERVAALVRAAGLPRVVDLYGGVGFLAAAARVAGVGDVTLVEAAGVAAAAARANLPGARVVPSTAEGYLRRPRSGSGTLAILDPPRRGLSREARDGMLRWQPEAIVLLACDPASLGRDAGALLTAGYELQSVELWDLFAGSHHVETLAVFRHPAP